MLAAQAWHAVRWGVGAGTQVPRGAGAAVGEQGWHWREPAQNNVADQSSLCPRSGHSTRRGSTPRCRQTAGERRRSWVLSRVTGCGRKGSLGVSHCPRASSRWEQTPDRTQGRGFFSARYKTFIDTHLWSLIKLAPATRGRGACRWAGGPGRASAHFRVGVGAWSPEDRVDSSSDTPCTPEAAGAGGHGVRKESDPPQLAEGPFRLQPLAMTKTVPGKSAEDSSGGRGGTSLAERRSPRAGRQYPLPESTIPSGLLAHVALRGCNGKSKCPSGGDKAAGWMAMVPAVSFPRRADHRGRSRTGLRDPCSLPHQPAGHHLAHCLGQFLYNGSLKEEYGWESPAGPWALFAGGCSVPWPPQSLAQGEGGRSVGSRLFSLPLGTKAAAQLLSCGKGSLEATGCSWILPPLQVLGSQEAFPEGHCISMVTVLGVPPPASASSAPSRRARWKTTLRGSHSLCDLSLPARK